jgi:hypothetical protein
VEHVETFVNELLAEWCVAALLLRALGGRTSPLRQPLPSREEVTGLAGVSTPPAGYPHPWTPTRTAAPLSLARSLAPAPQVPERVLRRGGRARGGAAAAGGAGHVHARGGGEGGGIHGGGDHRRSGSRGRAALLRAPPPSLPPSLCLPTQRCTRRLSLDDCLSLCSLPSLCLQTLSVCQPRGVLDGCPLMIVSLHCLCALYPLSVCKPSLSANPEVYSTAVP